MARRTMLVLLGVFVTAACTEPPAITEAPTDAGAPSDAGTPPTDSGATVDSSVEPPRGDAGPRPDAGRTLDCTDRGMTTPEIVELASGPAYCDKGWTLVLKADGTSPTSQWRFASPCWTELGTGTGTGMCPLPSVTGLEDFKNVPELRTAAFGTVAGKEMRIQARGAAQSEGGFVYAQVPTSLHKAMEGAAVLNPTMGVPRYLPVLPDGAQDGLFGINLGTVGFAQVRIGFVGGGARGGATPNAWSGVGGTFGMSCFTPASDPSPTAGSAYAPNCGATIDQVPTVTRAVIYVYVK